MSDTPKELGTGNSFRAIVALGLWVSLVLVGMQRLELASDDALVGEAVCMQLLDNTTEGRQALVGSVWWPPVPVLLRLPLVALFAPFAVSPLASIMVSAASAVALLLVLERFLCVWRAGYWRHLIWLAVLLNPTFLEAAVNGSSTTTAMVLLLVCAFGLVQWIVGRGVRNLVYFAIAAALLPVTSLEAAMWLPLPLLILLQHELLNRRPRADKEATLLLGLFPLLYVLALWVLLNWLIMGDGLYFARSLWRGGVAAAADAGQALVFGKAHYAFGALAAVVLVISTAHREKGGAYLALLASGPFVLALLLSAIGLSWDAGTVLLGTLPLGALLAGYMASHRPGKGRSYALAALIPLVVSVTAFFESGKLVADPSGGTYGEALAERGRWLSAIERHVSSRSTHAKVYVCGYDSFRLLGASERGPFLHALDFDFNQAQLDYYGHSLFVLVPQPERRNAMDSVHWKYDGIYSLGHRHTLYAGTWGRWRLFEIIQAPPFKEWR